MPIELDVQAGAEHDADLAEVAAQVDRADRQRRGRAAGTGDAAVARACRAVVARRRDDERVEPCGTGGRTRERAVGERRERLGDADERDARRVVRVAVGVRVDGALEPGEHLVGSARRRPSPRSRRAASPRRGSAAASRPAQRRTARRGRPTRRRALPSRSRAARAPPARPAVAAARASAPADDVDPRCDAPAQERMRTVDAGVEQRDRDAAAVDDRTARSPVAVRLPRGRAGSIRLTPDTRHERDRRPQLQERARAGRCRARRTRPRSR